VSVARLWLGKERRLGLRRDCLTLGMLGISVVLCMAFIDGIFCDRLMLYDKASQRRIRDDHPPHTEKE